MKEELLLSLSTILVGKELIKFRVEEISQIRQQLEPLLTDDELVEVTNKIRERIQDEAEALWMVNSCGAILMATGVGKTKVGVSAIKKSLANHEFNKALVVVPTEKLRDNGWPEELKKWGVDDIDRITITCYASLSKVEGKIWSIVIFDEGHNMTENNSIFFQNNSIEKVMWLSATKPSDLAKKQLLKNLGINPIYEITLDEATKLGLVSPFDITIVLTELDSTEKYIKAGNKEKGYFFTTELSNYQFLLKRIIAAPGKMMRLKRMRFIYDLKSKTRAGKWLLDNVIPKEARTMIFCGGKKQAIELCEHHYFSKPTKPKMPAKLKGHFDTSTNQFEIAAIEKMKEYIAYAKKLEEYNAMIPHYQGDESLNAFKEKAISRLSCVEALNEGHNFVEIDCALINQLNSTELNLWQRIGRTIRFRPGHKAKIIIVAANNTVDIDWVNKSIKNLDHSNIRWITFNDLKEGKETINFKNL